MSHGRSRVRVGGPVECQLTDEAEVPLAVFGNIVHCLGFHWVANSPTLLGSCWLCEASVGLSEG
jgi:hypothetical protein